MSTRNQFFTRDVEIDQYLDINGTLFLWQAIKSYIQDQMPEEFQGSNTFISQWDSSSALPISGNTVHIPQANFSSKILFNQNVFGMLYTDDTKLLIYGIVQSLNGVTKTAAVHTLWIYNFEYSTNGEADSVAWDNITGKPTDLVYTPYMNAAINSAISSFNTSLRSDLTTMEDNINSLQLAVSSRPTSSQVDQKINEKVSGVYRFAGSVPAYSNLPTSGMVGGDVYNIETNGMNYAWVEPKDGNPGYWDPLGATFSIEPIPNDVLQSIIDGTYGTR